MSSWQKMIVEQKEQWEKWVPQWPEANFLQSWNWGEFHRRLHKQVWAIAWRSTGAGDEAPPAALALVVKETAKRGTYLTVAGGPLLDWQNAELVTQVMTDLSQLASEAKAGFIRFRPQLANSPETAAFFKQLGAVESPMHLTADITVLLDLTKTEEELLAGMRKNTRYEVRQADKQGITVELSQNPADLEIMYQHQLELAKKHGFVPFSLQFWQEQFASFVPDNQVALFHAKQGETLLASAFILFYNGEAVYHYGTSTEANAKLPGSYACQWAAILEAKRRGCQRYNLWGIAPADQPNHRFAGVTTFKKGFSDQVVEYMPAHDLPVSKLYGVTRGFELLRKKLRRL